MLLQTVSESGGGMAAAQSIHASASDLNMLVIRREPQPSQIQRPRNNVVVSVIQIITLLIH